jgi:predicted dehydrogenase
MVAVYDSSPDAASSFVQLRPGVRIYHNFDHLLRDRCDFDFAVLATPGTTHQELGSRLLANGLHVLCEKPLALDAESAARMYEIADTRSVMLTPVHNYRFRDNALAALADSVGTAIGDPVTATLRFHSGSLFDEPVRWAREERKYRVLLFDWAYHFVDLALLFLGPVHELRFVDAEEDNLGLRYVVFGTLHRNGARGLFELTVEASCCRTELEVAGENRALMLEFFPNGFRLLPRRDTPMHRTIYDMGRIWRYSSANLRERFGVGLPERCAGHERLCRAFVASILGRGPNPVSREAAFGTVALLDAVAQRAYSSDRSGSLDERKLAAVNSRQSTPWVG